MSTSAHGCSTYRLKPTRTFHGRGALGTDAPTDSVARTPRAETQASQLSLVAAPIPATSLVSIVIGLVSSRDTLAFHIRRATLFPSSAHRYSDTFYFACSYWTHALAFCVRPWLARDLSQPRAPDAAVIHGDPLAVASTMPSSMPPSSSAITNSLSLYLTAALCVLAPLRMLPVL